MKKSMVIKLLVLILAFLVSVCFAVGCNNTQSGGNDSSKKEATPAEYFTFTLLEDNTYEVRAKDKNNLPAEIVIPRTYSGKAVTSVGSSAFSRCYSLTSVVIPDSVTSIGYSAFSLCRSLTSVAIGDSVTSIGYEAFWDCDSLTKITVSEDNANFKDIDGNLYTKDGKTLLQYATGKKDTSFTVPNGVETIGNCAFAYCDSLTSVVIGDSVTSIDDAVFYGCASLTSVKIPDSVTSIGDYAFCYCDSLTSVVIGDSVTSIGDSAFYYCSSLTSVEIPDSVTSIGDFAFEYCRSLTSVVIGDSVTSIGDYAFYRCNKLVEVINKSSHITVTKGSTSNGYVGCYALSVSNCDNTYISKLTNDNGYIIYTDGAEKVLVGYTGTETALTLPSYVTKIYQYAFGNCESLTSVVIGDSVTSIGDYAFYRCDNLTSVVIGDSVTSIGYGAFYGCSSLTSVEIGDSVTSIGNSAFADCYKLVEVINKSSHITVTKGSSSNGEVGYYALSVSNCDNTYVSKLTNDNGYIIYTDGVEKVLVGYTGTETALTLPSYVTKINQYAFEGCDRLTSVEIGDSVTSIGDFAFWNCDRLTSVVIGNSVTSIGSQAFSYCRSLTSIKYRGTKRQWRAIKKGIYWDDGTGGYTMTYKYTGE